MTKLTAVPGIARIVRPGTGEMFKAARYAVARNVNWHIKTRYREIDCQIAKFATLVEQLAVKLWRQPGYGFIRRALLRGRAFDRTDQEIRCTLSIESLTSIVSNNIRSNLSSTVRAIVRSHLPCFPFLRLLSKRNREARSSYEIKDLDSG